MKAFWAYMEIKNKVRISDKELIKFQQMHLDEVYNERDRLVALLTTFYPSYLAKHEGEDGNDNWRNVIYINTPEGQLSWHISDEEVPLFSHLPHGDNNWDGHTTEEKYKRIEKLVELNNKLNRKKAEQKLKDFANET